MKKKTKERKPDIILTKEAAYFDSVAETIDVKTIDVDNAFNRYSREGQFMLKHVNKNLKSKTVLDIGCGLGESTVFMAKKGAKVIGIDISPKTLGVGRKLAKIHGVSKLATFKTGDIQKLEYKDSSIDIVLGKAVLHHVNLPKAILEVHRVLKPGGFALFSDPLDYNPVVKIYDKFASDGLRSPGKRRLDLKDLMIVKAIFSKTNWIGTDITSLLLFFYYFLYLKITGKVEPNWFEGIQFGYILTKPYSFFNKIDNFIPKILQLLGWRIVIVCYK